ncbi:hypothetical protein PsorP6_001317 [Peronosclerospora sorghi]|uniref:Uncharacterized protein n=1 Tax=Peronosclerospora sorghi TaxID=230839 RepID=A0ACC0WWR3_9STRA|nr:hypothetical protein PsorP6_001317 [Peronosclerospora sorghi]
MIHKYSRATAAKLRELDVRPPICEVEDTCQMVRTSTSCVENIRVANLITGDVGEVHESRLRFYADGKLYVTEDILAHVAHNGEDHVDEQLVA